MSGEDELAEWVRNEQEVLWHDLDDAIRYAANGTWSIRAANVARRIVEAARLVGPTPSGHMPYRLSAGGVYEAVLRAGGIEPDLPSEDEWQRFDEMMAKHGATRAISTPQLAATVTAINEPREKNWINGGDE